VAEAYIQGDPTTLETATAQLGQAVGIEPDEMRATIATARAQYEEVARLAVGLSKEEWGHFSEFCGDKFQDERAEAARALFHHGDLNPVRALVAQFKEAGGGAAAGATDENVFAACQRQGIRVSRDPGNGVTYLHLPQGTMSWRTALAKGLITFQHGDRRSHERSTHGSLSR
jgi:hypothetical protein